MPEPHPASIINREQTNEESHVIQKPAIRSRHDLRQYAATARQRGDDHARAVLCWLWFWRLVDRGTVMHLRSISYPGADRVLSRLERLKLIARLPTTGVPVVPFYMTKLGSLHTEHIVEQFNTSRVEAITQPSGIKATTVAHNLLSGRIAVELMKTWHHVEPIRSMVAALFESRLGLALDPSAVTVTAISEAHCRTVFDEHSQKIPDGVLYFFHRDAPDHPVSIAIECQQSYESDMLRHVALSRYCCILSERTLDFVIYMSTRPSVLRLYQRDFNADLRPWSRSSRGKWFEDRDLPSPFADWMAERLILLSREDLERTYYSSFL